MKIKQICMVVLVWLGVIPAVHAQTFDKLWKEVEQAEKKSLPQTVIKLTDQIFRKGEKEKNSAQMLKAYMWRMFFRETLTPDSFYVSLKGLEQWAEQTAKPMDRAILHSLIAGIYADYAGTNQWQLRQRTEIVDETPPADLREWTANMFVEKVRTNVKEALADSVLLLKTSSRNYIPFVELGATSEYYHHDMYNLLASRAIKALNRIDELNDGTTGGIASNPVKQDILTIYENMLSAYKAAGLNEGYVLTALDYLEWRRWADTGFRAYKAPKGLLGLTQDPYIAALNELKSKFKADPVCAEVYLAQAQMFQQEHPARALQLCDEAIRLYPSYRRINALKNLRTEILSPFLNVNAVTEAYPGEEIKLKAAHKNIGGFTVYVYNKAKKLIKQQHYAVVRPEDYRTQDTAFSFKAPEPGAYIMRIVPDIRARRNSESVFNVTRFKVLTCRLPGKQYQVVALDGQSGHPISGATITLYNNEEKPLQKFTTDADGKVVFDWKPEYRSLTASKGADMAMPRQGIYGGSYGYYGDADETTDNMMLLTDRSLYRPGQTVHVKGIAYSQKSDTADVLSGKEYTVILLDANSQEVGQKKVRTNDFGSFATDFTLPSACLNGMFTLKAGRGRQSIRVEDYKRPTFDITFDKQQGSYQLGDEIQVKGKVESYSGVSLQDLPVKYTVRRSVYSLWRLMASTQIASGEVTAGAEGEFTIPVRLAENDEYKNDDRVYYRYTVEATATNVAGETQSSTDVISAGRRSLVLQMELPDKVRTDKPVEIEFVARNLNSQPVAVKGNYYLYRAKDKDYKQLEANAAATGTFTSNEKMTLHWSNLPSGAYLLKATVKDTQGKEVTADAQLILFSSADKRPPVQTTVWFDEENMEFDAAHPAVFSFGTSEKDAYVMMNVFCGDKLLESKTLNLSDTIVRFVYPYKESYGNGLFVNFCMVRDGNVYQEQARLTRRLPDKTLTMKWDVFRDKLRPGQKEEWKLTIKTPQGAPANAEMLATMYDASLDKIWKRQQYFRVFYNQILPYFNWMSGYSGNNSFNFWWRRTDLRVPSLEYDRFALKRWAMAMVVEDNAVVARGYSKQSKSALTGRVANMAAGKADVTFEEEMVEMKYVPVGATEEKDLPDAELLPEAPADLRTNLAETAFFYPQLRTNERGEVSFSFTMPESLTRWNFCGYSHTKGMLLGTLDGEATTSKEFMLTPNLPRFVRVGDKTSIAASISNMTGKPQAGTVSMILFDPLTEKVVSTQKQKFSIAAGKTIGVNFMFTVTDKYEILGCRMIADSGTFSDGEQQLLPVLSNKEHLVETLPMPIRGEETRTFSLDSLFNHHSKTATDRSLTIEFTGNPAWYAIQALPSLSLPANNNAISWATAYYANTLASYIMNNQPRIKAVFDSWKLQGGTKDTFLSNLQKNQELKNIILAESPWVLEAQTEEQQKERIATLFDLNNIRSNNIAALTRLGELQNAGGSWSWYKGMNGSRYVTAYIAELNARLALLTGEKLSGNAATLQQNAMKYLHKEALEEYKDILKARKEGAVIKGVSGSILQYLYIIAISGEQVPAANKAAYTYYLSEVKELLSSSSMETKAIAAIVLDKAGRRNEAQAFIASLKEHLTKTDEQGMFFAFNENPYTWGGMQLQAHVDVMEALEMAGGNSDTVEEMKLWLLKQKQTQQWDSPVATADAVYALLMKGTNLLDNQGDVRITIAGEVLETSAPGKTTVPGLGYLKRSFTEKNVVNARKIEVEKRTPGIAWGAVYAQYESPVSDVKQQGGELNVEKRLYVERTVNNTPQLQPITDKTQLQVGDKVVSRLSIRTGRAMDFVQLKDQRAACFEPVGSVSGYRWNNGLGYYVDIKDASTNFFFDHLGKGVYVLEYSYRVSRAGTYETGLATMQCAYAPEYASHSASMTVTVTE